MENIKNGKLNGVMYALFHLKNLDDARANRFMYNIYEPFIEKYDRTLQLKIIEDIESALEHGNIEESCTLPGLPGSTEFKKEYLEIVLGHLKEAVTC